MRLGIFGGSFDPVHYGHLLLAECCREQCRVGPGLVPAGRQSPAQAGSADSRAPRPRVEMLELAIGWAPGVSGLPTTNSTAAGSSYTVDTLTALSRDTPDAELFLLLGADMLADLPNWRKPREICRLALPMVVRRAGVRRARLRTVLARSPRRADRADSPPPGRHAGRSDSAARKSAAARPPGRASATRRPGAVEKYIADARAVRVAMDCASRASHAASAWLTHFAGHRAFAQVSRHRGTGDRRSLRSASSTCSSCSTAEGPDRERSTSGPAFRSHPHRCHPATPRGSHSRVASGQRQRGFQAFDRVHVSTH